MLRSLVLLAAKTSVGRRAIECVLLADPEPFVPVISAATSRGETFDRVQRWPEALRGFEDLTFLFSSNRANAGIASLAFDEAALLYRTVADLPPDATVVEIGRFRGGSAFLIAAALPEDGVLWSYDPHYKRNGEPDPDGPLRDALARYGLASRVKIIVGDSRNAPPPPEPCSLVFVDGDHSYEGVRADYERWRAYLAPGGHLLFHDAERQRPFAPYEDGVRQLVREISGDARLERLPGAGSLVHFRSR